MSDKFLWKGRIEKEFDREAFSFSSSLNIDRNLFEEDILNTLAHSKTLNKIGIISEEEIKKIEYGLLIIKDKIERGEINFDEEKYEDIHSFIEFNLKEIIGETAEKIHAGRSRNDQIATDERLWAKKACDILINLIIKFQKILAYKAEEHIYTIMPGYTHLQRAQVISLGYHLLSYAEGMERDKKRFLFVKEESDDCPLGCGAIAGSTIDLDREFSAKYLGFSSISANGMDGVSDRDFFLDFLNACSICSLRLSRLCEDLFLWSSKEWNFARLPDEFVTGSSLMPQKKNPDIIELIRAKSSRTVSNYLNLSMILKALPMAYCRDLQEDKASVFEAYENLISSLNLLCKIIDKMEFNVERFEKEILDSFMWATDLADYLVKKKNPFRKAHSIVASLVSYIEKENVKISDLNLNDLKKFSDCFEEDALNIIFNLKSFELKKTYGSPNPVFVKKRIDYFKEI